MGFQFTATKILSKQSLSNWLAEQKTSEKTIVFTNGCFDLLHPGHIQYLEEARSLGDLLFIGLNDDASVRRLKGAERPILDQQARATILAALHCVDAVCLFSEDTPYELILRVQPDILVKGGDYRPEEIVGADIVPIVKVLSFQEGYSTSSIIQKIKKKKEAGLR